MSAKVIVLVIFGAVVGVLAGAELAGRLPSHILRKAFAIFLIAVAVRMFIGSSRPKERGPDNSLPVQKKTSLVEPGGENNEC